jgi:hypothetical protein
MSCKWCHETPPPNRKDGYCSDICLIHGFRAEIERLRAGAKVWMAGADRDADKIGLLEVEAQDWRIKCGELIAEIERLRATVTSLDQQCAEVRAHNTEMLRREGELKQRLSQAGDTIELQEAEQRGYVRAKAEHP